MGASGWLEEARLLAKGAGISSAKYWGGGRRLTILNPLRWRPTAAAAAAIATAAAAATATTVTSELVSQCALVTYKLPWDSTSGATPTGMCQAAGFTSLAERIPGAGWFQLMTTTMMIKQKHRKSIWASTEKGMWLVL